MALSDLLFGPPPVEVPDRGRSWWNKNLGKDTTRTPEYSEFSRVPTRKALLDGLLDDPANIAAERHDSSGGYSVLPAPGVIERARNPGVGALAWHYAKNPKDFGQDWLSGIRRGHVGTYVGTLGAAAGLGLGAYALYKMLSKKAPSDAVSEKQGAPQG